MENSNSRRSLIKTLAGGAALTALTGSMAFRFKKADEMLESQPMKGRINHSVCKWCYNSISLDDLCVAAKRIGIQAIDLIDVSDFEIVKKHGLNSGIVSSLSKDWGITKGWNKREHHDALEEYYKYLIDKTSEAGFKNLICFPGNREAKLSDEEGLRNSAKGLKKIMKYAERKKVTLVMELLNSKIDHKDYMCDHTNWGVELCKEIDSDNFKLLYDIYHMQIMEGDVIRTIRDNNKYIAHYHTAGVPGRHEIDETQELYYPAIMNAIAETGFKGFVAQEFIPVRADKLGSLKQAIELCDV